MQHHDIIVIGASAGGLEVLPRVIAPLSRNLPASLFVVIHASVASSGPALLQMLQSRTDLPCLIPEDGQTFRPGYLYLAPPDQHLLISEGKIGLTQGARENGFRPAIDTLFRSAAVYYDSRVIGVLLSGMLYDGTVGLEAIKRCGGLTVVQDPDEALFADMPRNALLHVDIDYSVASAEIGVLLGDLVHRVAESRVKIPEDLKAEVRIVERTITATDLVNAHGSVSNYSCPDCGGSLWEMPHSQAGHFRCHVGHAYSAQSLLYEKDRTLEEALWVALRILEERRNMLAGLLAQAKERGRDISVLGYEDRIQEAQTHIARIREVLTQPPRNQANTERGED
jgi:two-component system, chemotaxis family, protein-glutamate methylesterase/glutaminase